MSDLPKAGLPDEDISAPESPEAPEAAPPTRQVNKVSRWRMLILTPAAWVLRAWTASLRFEITEHEQALMSYTVSGGNPAAVPAPAAVGGDGEREQGWGVAGGVF
jgi:hypothetical protein